MIINIHPLQKSHKSKKKTRKATQTQTH